MNNFKRKRGEIKSGGIGKIILITGGIVLVILFLGIFLVRFFYNAPESEYSTAFCNAVLTEDPSIMENYSWGNNQTSQTDSNSPEKRVYTVVTLLYHKNIVGMQTAYIATGSKMYVFMQDLFNGNISNPSEDLCSQISEGGQKLNSEQLNDCRLIIILYDAFKNNDLNSCKKISSLYSLFQAPKLSEVCIKLINKCE